ncbi:MAG: hypothetical protein SAJ37_13430 [Oscillatoria sp. PMC 1068.18]|nr:hypothetical protein [Oscillatoria sp. PMC 1076.18]MEC4989726.1 hypothetical protein [Oscillatoria sp. PMC 1068.18]
MALYASQNKGLVNKAVFYEKVKSNTDLEQVALRYHQQFVGSYWRRDWHQDYSRSIWQKILKF